ncbi:MAG: DNA repair protein RecN, partial [Chloroflexota bacterium]|nr:DNA repair protein RecN [Chloroflexota bacterium]
DRARIEALFDVAELRDGDLSALLTAHGIEAIDGQLVLTREIHANGRSVARINGQIVTVSLLSQVGDALVDIHGQSDHFSIRRRDEQRQILDHYAGTDGLVEEVAGAVARVLAIREQIESLDRGQRERAHRRDLLAFQVQEIESALLVADEDAQLMQEQRMLAHAEQLRADTERALVALAESDTDASTPEDASSLLRALSASLVRVGEIDSQAISMVELSAELVILAEELARDLRTYLDGMEVDESRLAIVDDRLDTLRTLKKKYGATIEDVLAFHDNASRELERLTGGDFDREALSARLESCESNLVSNATELSMRRTKAAERLAGEIEASIEALHLGSATIQVRVDQVEDGKGLRIQDSEEDRRVRFGRTGIDEIEFMIAANRGETPRPLGRVASGGETARIMLAIKSIVAAHDSTPTLVFDEIDVGVGGRTGQVVGERLRELSANRQVIVITHLPQIAAVADRHARIEKVEQDGRVVSSVRPLDATETETEIAAMLDGEPVTATAIEAARAMIRRGKGEHRMIEV